MLAASELSRLREATTLRPTDGNAYLALGEALLLDTQTPRASQAVEALAHARRCGQRERPGGDSTVWLGLGLGAGRRGYHPGRPQTPGAGGAAREARARLARERAVRA